MTHYDEELPDRDPTPPWSEPHNPDAALCFCDECSEREYQRQQEDDTCEKCGGSGGGDPPFDCRLCGGSGRAPLDRDNADREY